MVVRNPLHPAADGGTDLQGGGSGEWGAGLRGWGLHQTGEGGVFAGTLGRHRHENRWNQTKKKIGVSEYVYDHEMKDACPFVPPTRTRGSPCRSAVNGSQMRPHRYCSAVQRRFRAQSSQGYWKKMLG